jgi:hypothetical protein
MNTYPLFAIVFSQFVCVRIGPLFATDMKFEETQETRSLANQPEIYDKIISIFHQTGHTRLGNPSFPFDPANAEESARSAPRARSCSTPSVGGFSSAAR